MTVQSPFYLLLGIAAMVHFSKCAYLIGFIMYHLCSHLANGKGEGRVINEVCSLPRMYEVIEKQQRKKMMTKEGLMFIFSGMGNLGWAKQGFLHLIPEPLWSLSFPGLFSQVFSQFCEPAESFQYIF